MKRAALIVFALAPAMLIGCSRKPAKIAAPAPTAYGAAITEVSGERKSCETVWTNSLRTRSISFR